MAVSELLIPFKVNCPDTSGLQRCLSEKYFTEGYQYAANGLKMLHGRGTQLVDPNNPGLADMLRDVLL